MAGWEHTIAVDLHELSDARLTSLALAGSQPAFQEIVRRYERPVFNLIVRIVRDAALAEDVAQIAFLKTFRSLGSFDEARRFSSWILRIANNAALDALRRRRADPVVAADIREPAAPPPPDQVEAAQLARAIDAALDTLRPDWRAAVVLRYQEGLSYEEVAEILGIPEGTVKTFVHRARKQLCERLTAAGWRP
jgi:RNA polymerase sigma-70 factor (ECF subfamily)